MIYTHVLNRGGRGVRSPLARDVQLFRSLTNSERSSRSGAITVRQNG